MNDPRTPGVTAVNHLLASGPENGSSPVLPADLLDQLFTVIGLMRQHVTREVGRVDLSAPQAHALRLLEPGQPVPMRALADGLHCDASTVTGIVDRLEQRGLVERRPDRVDRRVKTLVITDDGAAVRRQLWEGLLAGSPLVAALDDDDLAVLGALLAKVVRQTGAAPPPGGRPNGPTSTNGPNSTNGHDGRDETGTTEGT